MSSTSETGHAKNVANLGRLLAICTTFGTAYNPSKSTLSLEGLKTMETKSNEVLNQVKQALSVYGNASAAREELFSGFGSFVTRIGNALKASESTPEIDEKAKSIVAKIQGRRAKAKLTEEEKQELEAQGKSTKEISSAQVSFDSRIDNFEKLVVLLESIPAYNPNEEELKITSLKKYLTDLRAKNNAVTDAEAALNTARISRNELLYTDNTGVIDVTVDVKTYVKSVFGATAPQYKQISSLEFRKYKN